MESKTILNVKNLLLLLVALLLCNVTYAQSSVSGTVQNSADLTGIADVKLRLKGGKTFEATTDKEGRFAIQLNEGTTHVLVFTHPDFDTKEVFINDDKQINVLLTSNVRYNQYGKRVKRSILGAEARNGILTFESEDGNYKYWFDNRVYLDGAVFFGDPINPIGNGITLRRVRFALKSILHEKWYTEIDFDFGESKTEIKDAYIKYILDDGFIKAGQFREGFSMETTTTSRYVTFIERSLVSRFAPSRQLGFAGSKWGKHWLAIGGIHFQNQGDGEEVNISQDANKDDGTDEGYSFTGRFAFMPIQEPHKVLHIGAAASYRTPTTDVEIPNSYRFSTRSLTAVNRKKYIDTDDITDVDHRTLFGVEVAGAYNNLMFQGEYITNNVNGIDDSFNANFDGGYFQVGWLLLGAKYVYNNQEGEFTQASLTDKGGLEFAFRYSYVDVNDADAGILGGAGESLTLGINYYVNPNIKFMLNYNYLNHDRYATGKGELFIYEDESGEQFTDVTGLNVPAGDAGDDFSFFSVRFEVDF